MTRPRRKRKTLARSTLALLLSCLLDLVRPDNVRAVAAEPAIPALAIEGVVVDAATGAPVSGVSVYLTETGDAALSDERGRFALEVPQRGRYALAVIDPGFERVDLVVDAPLRESLVLRVSGRSVRGEEVVVEAQRDRPAPGATAITREEVTRVPGARGDLLTTVKSLPGVANTSEMGMTSGLVIRGAAPGDSKILVDGFEVPLLYHFGGLQSVLPSEMIDDLVYTPGGFGVEQGRATGGVVQVTPRKGGRELGGFMELSFINGAALARGPVGDRGSFTVAARRSVIDAILPAVMPSDAQLSFSAAPRYYDYQVRADYALTDRMTLSAFVFGSDDGFEALSTAESAQDPALSGRFLGETRFTRGILSAEYDGKGVRNKAGVSAMQVATNQRVGDTSWLDMTITSVTARDEARLRLAPFATLAVGGEIDRQRYDVDLRIPRPPREGDPAPPNFTLDEQLVFDDRVDLTSVAAWAALDLDPTSWLRVTPGVRVDGFTRQDEWVVQPRLQARAEVVRGTTLRAAGGLYTRPPRDDELIQTRLAPERAYQVTGGLEQELAPGLTLQLSGFRNFRRDLIVYRQDREHPGAPSGADTYDNAGEGSSYGGELHLQSRGDRHFAWASYTLARSVRQDRPGTETRPFDYDQTHNLVLVGSVKLGRGRNWQVGGRFQLTSGRPYTPVVGAELDSDANVYAPQFGRTNSARVEAQHQLDLRVDRTWSFQSWKLSAYLDISNVYMNAAAIDYRYNFDYSERKAIKSIPILPAIGIRGEI